MRALSSSKALRNVTALGVVALVIVLLAGCKGISTPGERIAQSDWGSVSEAYRPQNQRPALPTLQTNASLSNFLQFAILNQPQVEAAYFDWAASVRRITVERSLPDPRLTFSSDIADMVMSLMPGLMMDFPGPGKLKWAANVASAEISGLTDMDAITLSVTQLVNSAGIAPGTGWRLILVAAMANLAFKTATVAAFGEQRLLRLVAVGFGAAAVTGAAMMFYGSG